MLFSVFLVVLWISKLNLLSEQTGDLFHSLCCFSFSLPIFPFRYFCIWKHSTHHTPFVTPCSCPAFWFLCVHCSGKLPKLLSSWLLLSFCSLLRCLFFLCFFCSFLFQCSLLPNTCLYNLSATSLFSPSVNFLMRYAVTFQSGQRLPSLPNWYRHSRNDKIHAKNHIQL